MPRIAASHIVQMLDLKPHPEGGFYSETFRDDSIVLSRSQLPPRCTYAPNLFEYLREWILIRDFVFTKLAGQIFFFLRDFLKWVIRFLREF